MPDPIRLAVADKPRRFSAVAKDADSEQDFLTELRRSALSTQRRPVTSVQQVMLDAQGRTVGGFRYSVNALRQLCRLLGRGLSQAVFDLGGAQVTGDGLPTDAAMAIRWLNDVLRLRFDQKLKDYELIVDVQQKRIDGLVGTRYAYLSNAAFYDRVRRVLGDFPVKFHEAVLFGRRMTVRYRTKSPIFALDCDAPEPFFGGFHFGNSEVGDCSVSTAVLLIRQRADTKAVSGFSDRGRLQHIRGPQFAERLGVQLTAIRERADEPAQLRTRLDALRRRSLELVGSEEAIRRRVAALTRRLQQWGLHRALAQRVLSRVQLLGSAPADDIAGSRTGRQGPGNRTEWDLFNAMTFVAKRQPPDSQERLEQLAYQLVQGRKTLA